MFAPDVNEQIRLHFARVIAAGAGPRDRLRMFLNPVLVEAALLDKGRAASRLFANMGHRSRMLLHMVVHSILVVFCDTEPAAGLGAYKSIFVTNIHQVHRTDQGSWDPGHQVFAPALQATNKFIV